jgi:radical SAM superfamily enzyme YgiQ (UPF0313 family)
MKILLINSPAGDIYGSMKSIAGRYFPLGLGYISSYLKKAGHEVRLIDPDAQMMEMGEIAAIARNENPDIIGISSFTPNFHNAAAIATKIRSFSGAQIILGGIHASTMPGEILKNHPEFDVIVIGEGEATIAELSRISAGGCSCAELNKINGIAFRENGSIIITPPREFIKDVDSLPFPDRAQIDLRLFTLHKHMDIGKRYAEMLTSRGCPFNCTFCASHLTSGRGFRPHSPEYVVNEIKFLRESYGIEHIVFQDDTFTLQESRVTEICERLLRDKISIYWSCWARVNTVNRKLLTLMRKSGCFSIGYGVESGDENVLKAIKKGITLDQCREAFRISHELGLKTLGFFIFGCTGDTPETVEKTVRFAIELNPSIALFTRMIPYPGTEVYQQKAADTAAGSWGNYKYFDATVKQSLENFPGVDLDKLCASANRRFYLRPSYFLKQLFRFRTLSECGAFAYAGLSLFRIMLTKATDSAYEKAKSKFNNGGILRSFYIWFRLLTCPFKKIESFLPGRGVFIDIGCGSGFFTMFMAMNAPERNVLGIDWKQDRINHAISISRDIPNVSFRNCDIGCCPRFETPQNNAV